MRKITILTLLICGALHFGAQFAVNAQETPKPTKESSSQPVFEYASVRFMEERTTIFWPDGTFQNVLEIVGKKKFSNGEYYPKGADYRMYWLTIAMNIMAQRGFDLVHMHDNDVVMKRLVTKK